MTYLSPRLRGAMAVMFMLLGVSVVSSGILLATTMTNVGTATHGYDVLASTRLDHLGEDMAGKSAGLAFALAGSPSHDLMLATFRTAPTAVASGVATEAGGFTRIPLGFGDSSAWRGAVADIRAAPGASDVLAGVPGSAANGISASRGVVGRNIGDIDAFIVSDELYPHGGAAGARGSNGALRVGVTQRYFPKIAEVEQQLSESLGTKTTVRIFSREGWECVRTGWEVLGQ